MKTAVSSSLKGASSANEGQTRSKVHLGADAFDPRPLAVRTIAIMVTRYEALPPELWDLSREPYSDLKEKRRLCLTRDMPDDVLQKVLPIQRFDIHEIQTDYRFNKELHPLPACLRTIRVGSSFKHPLTLPPLIELVDLGSGFDHPVDLPSTVRRLVIEGEYTHPIRLPHGLREAELTFCEDYAHSVTLPSTLRELYINTPAALPPLLESVTWKTWHNFIGPLPSNLQELYIAEGGFDHPLDFLPSTLRILDIEGSTINHPLDLPTGLKEIHLNTEFTHPLTYPVGLQIAKLYFTEEYAHPINLPRWLKELHIQQNISIPLPPNLIKISLGCDFDQQIVLPRSVQEVHMENEEYSHVIVLPPACRFVCNGHTFIFSKEQALAKHDWQGVQIL